MVANAEINPNGYYDQEAVGELLSIPLVRITKAIKANELRHSKRAGKAFFRGQWLIDWLDGKSKDKAQEAVAS